QIDGISGATISSAAVGKLMGDSTQKMIPFLQHHRDELKLEQ
ncbi:MAG: FMN-binding protein, partial [Candidatus Hydrogenedentes bacterium]|nr:FMN-binding protein [Candidatus Hydrogenedentota bacterium]